MSPEPPVDPAGIARRTFPTGRRGYDTRRVTAYLEELARLVEDLTRREAEARARAEAAEAQGVDLAAVGRDRLVELVDAEIAQALDDARAAASDIRTKAQESAARLIAAGQDEAKGIAAAAESAAAVRRVELLAEAESLRAEAAGELDRRRAEATEAAAAIRAEADAERARLVTAGEEARALGRGDASEERANAAAEAEAIREAATAEAEATLAGAREAADRLRVEARRDADAVRKEAAHGARATRQEALRAAESARVDGREEAALFVADARAEAQHLVAEALAVREKILGDLARRRHVARQQVERLNAARERLLSAYATIRRTVDEATSELSVALPAARAASDHAARRVRETPAATVEQVEAEISAARMAGLVDERTGAGLGEIDVSALAERLGVDPRSHLSEALTESTTLANPLPPSPDDDPPASHAGPVTADPVAELAAEAEAMAEVVAQLDRAPAEPAPAPPAPAPPTVPGGTPGGAPAEPGPPGGGEPGDASAAFAPASAATGTVAVPPDASPPAGAAASTADELAAHAEVVAEPDHEVASSPRPGGDAATVEPAAPATDRPPASGVADADEPAPVVPAARDEVFAPDVVEPGPEVEPIEVEVVESPSVVEVVANARSRLDDLFARVRQGSGGVNGSPAPSPGHNGHHTGDGGERGAGRLPEDEAVTVPDDHHRTSWPTPDERAAARASAARGPGSPDAPADADLLEQRDTALAEVERTLSRRLKRVLADEENEVLDLLRRGVPEDPAEVVPERAEHAARYARAAVDQLEEAAHRGALLVLGPDGRVAGAGTKAAAKHEKRRHDHAAALADDLGDSLVEPLRQRVVRSLAEGGDVDEVLGRFRALYREWKGQRVRLGVRHFAAAAYGAGAIDALAAGTELRWLVDRAGEPCPDADDNALAEGVRKGQAFPTGDRCAPAHPGCRCLVVPAAGVASP